MSSSYALRILGFSDPYPRLTWPEYEEFCRSLAVLPMKFDDFFPWRKHSREGHPQLFRVGYCGALAPFLATEVG